MARPLRIKYRGALYRVTARGNARQAIFRDDRDRKRFRDVLASVVEKSSWLCHAYCLMENHYHLVLETPHGNPSRGMRQLAAMAELGELLMGSQDKPKKTRNRLIRDAYEKRGYMHFGTAVARMAPAEARGASFPIRRKF